MVVEIGQKAPDFTLKDPSGDEVSLSDFAGRKNVVIHFFPSAFSGVCTEQFTRAQADSDRYGEEVQVLGISVDSHYSQGAFAESLGLTDVTLLADFEPKGGTARAYGMYLEKFGISGRATFVVDKAGVIRGIERTENPGQLPDEEGYFASLAACAT